MTYFGKKLSAPVVNPQQRFVATGEFRSFDSNCIIQTLSKTLALGARSF